MTRRIVDYFVLWGTAMMLNTAVTILKRMRRSKADAELTPAETRPSAAYTA